MKKFLKSTVVTAGLAVFSMLFGAANLIYPVKVGIDSGDNLLWGLIGFLLTTTVLPVLGLVSIILFNGDYNAFFNRLGKISGIGMIGFCMGIIGPFIAMPRIVTLSYSMLYPFLPEQTTLLMYSLGFCAITFLATYRENKIISLLGNLISPALLLSLGVILIKGMLNPQPLIPTTENGWNTFANQAILGYANLDLLGGIFFGSIVLMLLKKTTKHNTDYNLKNLALTGMKAGFFGAALLAIVYIGMALLGAFYGTSLVDVNPAELFSIISFKVLGHNGALIIATAVAMACFSTIIALATVLAEYIHHEVSNSKMSYISALVGVLGLTTFISCYGLSNILLYSAPIINTLHPVIIVLTFLNIAYKTIGFRPVKFPVLLTLIFAIYLNYPTYSIYMF